MQLLIKVYTNLFETLHMFSPFSWFGFNPAFNFCHFSTLLTLSISVSFFTGATSTSPKFDLFGNICDFKLSLFCHFVTICFLYFVRLVLPVPHVVHPVSMQNYLKVQLPRRRGMADPREPNQHPAVPRTARY